MRSRAATKSPSVGTPCGRQQGLRKVGLIENRDIILDVVWMSGDPDQAVSEVLRRGAELLIPCGSSASVAAKGQTSTIPIVLLNVGDPMAMGLVESLSRPGRNATGFSDILAELSGKFVDLAREVIKPQTTVDYLWHTAWPDSQNRHHATEQAAQAAGMKLRSKGIADIAELDDALRAIKQSGSTTLIVQPSPFTYGQRGRIIASAMKNGLGTIFGFPVAAQEGSLIAYGPTTSTCTVERRSMWTVSLKEPTQPISRLSSLLRSSSSSTCRPLRRLGSRCRCLCSFAPTS
jgi:putative tryptophan/tyrosine transport system substrate-binding protein